MEKNESSRRGLRVLLVIILFVSAFLSPGISFDDLSPINLFTIAAQPVFVEGGSTKGIDRIDFTVNEHDKKLELQRHDLNQANVKAILTEFMVGDRVQLGVIGSRVYYVTKGGNEYTNLEEANKSRKQINIWGVVLSIIGLVFSFISDSTIKDLGIIFYFIVGFVLIITCLILYLTIGAEHVF